MLLNCLSGQKLRVFPSFSINMYLFTSYLFKKTCKACFCRSE